MKKWLCLVLGILAAGQPASAGALDMMLALPPGKVMAGQPLQITILVYNTATRPAAVELPGSLAARLQPPDQPQPLTVKALLTGEPARVQVAPGHFHKAHYSLTIPPDLDGPITLEMTPLPAAPLMFAVTPAPEEKPAAPAEIVTARATPRQDKLANNFFGHEPVYFLVGANPTHAKFQISFKYRLLDPEGSLARRWQRFENIYFGYTQTSFWDWESDSAPFYDSSYKPEFFYYRPNIPQNTIDWISRFSFQGGALHESNGKDGADSRSLNMVYIKPGAQIDTGEHSYITIEPRVWAYVGDLDDNPDIARYRGYFDLEMAWKRQGNWKLATTLRKGTDTGKGSAQFDLSYPLRELLLGNLDVYLQMQYYTGYAETLLSYDESHDFFRIGLSMFR